MYCNVNPGMEGKTEREMEINEKKKCWKKSAGIKYLAASSEVYFCSKYLFGARISERVFHNKYLKASQGKFNPSLQLNMF